MVIIVCIMKDLRHCIGYYVQRDNHLRTILALEFRLQPSEDQSFGNKTFIPKFVELCFARLPSITDVLCKFGEILLPPGIQRVGAQQPKAQTLPSPSSRTVEILDIQGQIFLAVQP